jgi:hypothetical protein
MHGLTASSQQTVDGTPRKEFNKKTEKKRPRKQKQFFGCIESH